MAMLTFGPDRHALHLYLRRAAGNGVSEGPQLRRLMDSLWLGLESADRQCQLLRLRQGERRNQAIGRIEEEGRGTCGEEIRTV